MSGTGSATRPRGNREHPRAILGSGQGRRNHLLMQSSFFFLAGALRTRYMGQAINPKGTKP